MLKLKEEFDYKSLSRRLDIQLDKLIAEQERQQKAFEDEIERITLEAESRISEAERNYADALEVSTCIGIISNMNFAYVLRERERENLCERVSQRERSERKRENLCHRLIVYHVN